MDSQNWFPALCLHNRNDCQLVWYPNYNYDRRSITVVSDRTTNYVRGLSATLIVEIAEQETSECMRRILRDQADRVA
jgi:hypothetical protein